MDSNSLLDALKAKNGITSEYALAKKVLNVSEQALKMMRQRGLSDHRALQVATLLELPPGEVLASIHAERAKSPEVKAVWKTVAESMRSALGMVAAAALALSLLLPAGTVNAGESRFTSSTYYTT